MRLDVRRVPWVAGVLGALLVAASAALPWFQVPEALAPRAKAIGPTVIPKSLPDALKADVVILAIPFPAHRELAKANASWQGKLVIDVTNAFGIEPDRVINARSATVMSGRASC